MARKFHERALIFWCELSGFATGSLDFIPLRSIPLGMTSFSDRRPKGANNSDGGRAVATVA